MATKKPAPKSKAAPEKARPKPPTKPPSDEHREAGWGFGKRVAAHMAGHDHPGDPWANMNAGGVCGICGSKLA
jgi:hypothetical protein